MQFLVSKKQYHKYITDYNLRKFRDQKLTFADHIWARINPQPQEGSQITDDSKENELNVVYPLPYSLLTVKPKQNNSSQKWDCRNGLVKYAETNLVLGIYEPDVAKWPSGNKSEEEFLCLIRTGTSGIFPGRALQYTDGKYKDPNSRMNVNFKLKAINEWCRIQKRKRWGRIVELFVE